ncbi:MAG: Cocaine esterase [Haliscomenobacter sp.]|nr:Cocaine esterase [Haliscomenobacter sp.]
MNKRIKNAVSLALLLFWLSGMHGQTIAGDWYGLMDVVQAKLRINLHVKQSDNAYTATLDSPDQGAVGVPVDFSLDKDKVKFSLDQYQVAYEGKVSPDGSAILGTFSQGAQNFVLNFQRKPFEASEGSADWIKERLTKQEVYITMRDGTRLFTSIYTPKDTTRSYPILMTRTPYNIEGGGPNGLNYHLFSRVNLIKEGYIFVFQDVRGKYMSEGTYMDVRPHNPNKTSNKEVDESSDTYDSIDWLIKNVRNNNGRVGIFGVSYPGFYSTTAIMDAHPALKAASPQAPVTDWFIGDDFHHNGAFFLMDAFSFYSSFGKPRPEPTRQGKPGFNFPVQDNYRFYLDIGPIKNIREKYFGDTIQFWGDLMSHPNYDDFWKARNPRPHLKNVKPAVLTVGGFFDAEDSFGPFGVYRAIETQNPPSTQNRLLMGPWSHGQWSGGVANNMGNMHWGFNTAEKYKELEGKFFRHYLKDEGAMDIAEATIFISGENKWHDFATWPPQNVETKSLYFQPSGGLSFSKPTSTAGYREYVSDPANPVPYTEDVHLGRTTAYMTDDQRFADRRPDVAVYQTTVLEEDVTLTGPLTADLWVSTTGTDADYVVKLIDVFPDSAKTPPGKNINVPLSGYQMLVRGEVMRGRFRNSYEKPEPLVPGKTTRVKFVIPDVAHTFKKGHRIMVQVQNSWFPLVDRNPQKFVNIYECSESDFQKATQRIFHNSTYPSSVQVTVLKK